VAAGEPGGGDGVVQGGDGGVPGGLLGAEPGFPGIQAGGIAEPGEQVVRGGRAPVLAGDAQVQAERRGGGGQVQAGAAQCGDLGVPFPDGGLQGGGLQGGRPCPFLVPPPECVRFFVRGDFFLSGSGCLPGVFSSRYLMCCCPFYPAVTLNRAFRAVPGLMLRVPVIAASRSFRVPLPDPPGIALRPFPSVI